MTIDPGQMVPQRPSWMSPELWELRLPHLASRPVEPPVSVPSRARYGHGIPEPLLVVGDLVDIGVAQYEVVERDGRLVLDGPVNRRGDVGGLW